MNLGNIVISDDVCPFVIMMDSLSFSFSLFFLIDKILKYRETRAL